MTEYSDVGHRPNADFKGERIQTDNDFVFGPDGIVVDLESWGPNDVWAFDNVLHQMEANFGDAPVYDELTPEKRKEMGYSKILNSAFGGRTQLPATEQFSFSFMIDGVSRACTHQIVRTRLGASFSQHGGRANDWRHRKIRLPETIRRAIIEHDEPLTANLPDDLTKDFDWDSPVDNRKPMQRVQDRSPGGAFDSIAQALRKVRILYADLVDAGIPYQDARRLLPIGTTTYIYATYNWPALVRMLGQRLEHTVDWEINCVAQLMRRQIIVHCPSFMSLNIKSFSDMRQSPAYAELTDWPPDEKYPTPPHFRGIARYHRKEQNPFWVLTPNAMAGGPIEWIPTNGEFPDEWKNGKYEQAVRSAVESTGRSGQ